MFCLIQKTPVLNAFNCPNILIQTCISDLGNIIKMLNNHYGDIIMRAMASQITSLTIVCSNVYSGADQIKHQSSTSLPFVEGIHRWPVNFPHKGPVTRKMFPFDDVIMWSIDFSKDNGSLYIQCQTIFFTSAYSSSTQQIIISSIQL